MKRRVTSRRRDSLSGTKIRAKIVLIGDGGVGKTALRRAWLGEGFKTEYLMTIGADFYYRGAVGALVFYDVTNQESYMNLVEWIQSYWNLNAIGKSPLLIVGSKCDLRDNPAFPNQVSSHYGKEYAAEITKLLKHKYGFSVHYIETSAKEDINIDKVFKLLANEIISSVSFSEKKKNDRSTSQRKMISDQIRNR
ncbi:MAG: Rab family GTPase [Candidatus Hodarchaeales archaeon]